MSHVLQDHERQRPTCDDRIPDTFSAVVNVSCSNIFRRPNGGGWAPGWPRTTGLRKGHWNDRGCKFALTSIKAIVAYMQYAVHHLKDQSCDPFSNVFNYLK